MTEYKVGCARVRLHGTPDMDKVKTATERFLKRVEAKHKKEGMKKNV